MIYPNHGAGSPCGADIGARLSSTIGYERKFNKFLQFTDAKRFTDYAIQSAPPVPHYYPLMKRVNAEGPKVIGNLPRVPGLPPNAFKEAIDKKAGVLVDVRTMLGFGGGHISGALNIGGTPILSIWAGWMLDPEKPILLVMENDDDLERIVRLFVRTGFTKFAGYLIGGMKAWDATGFPLERIGQMSVHELNERKDSLQIVDARSPGEWKKGHVPGAQHIFVPELAKRMVELDRNKPTAVYCGSGYRASIATSILKPLGFTDVWNVPGSWEAWKKAKLPVEGADSK
jgi:hydroxyacylglutathione hydrolase